MGEPTFVNVLVKTKPNFPTPTRGTGTIGIFGYTKRVDTGYIGEEIVLSATGAITIAAGSTITRATGSWITDGISVDDKVVLTGSTSDDGTYIVTAVTSSTVLTFVDVFTGSSETQDEINIYATSSTVDATDPAVKGEVKSFSNLYDIQERYGYTSSIARSSTEAIQNNCSMPLILMPISASGVVYDRVTSSGEAYSSGDVSLVLTDIPALPVTVIEDNNPLIEGYDASSSDFWVDVGNKTVHFHTARGSAGAVFYRNIQSADITTYIANLLPKVVNFIIGSYSMGNTIIQDEIFNHVLSAYGTTRKRIGIVSNAKGIATTTIATSYATDRMVAIAHKSKRDINIMTAAVLSRLSPQTSLVLKVISGDYSDDNFTDTEYEAFDTAQMISLVNSEFTFGEKYEFDNSFTLSSDSIKKYIDGMRVIDDVTFKIRATLTNPALLGEVKLATKAGMATLRVIGETFFANLVSIGEIDAYSILIPGEEIVKKASGIRTAEEVAKLASMVTLRKFTFIGDIVYSGAVHRIDVELNFSNV